MGNVSLHVLAPVRVKGKPSFVGWLKCRCISRCRFISTIHRHAGIVLDWRARCTPVYNEVHPRRRSAAQVGMSIYIGVDCVILYIGEEELADIAYNAVMSLAMSLHQASRRNDPWFRGRGECVPCRQWVEATTGNCPLTSANLGLVRRLTGQAHRGGAVTACKSNIATFTAS